ncbi:hypothetical protein PLICRDRAFT_144064 [Plicaturopsis crispa FD-325 SS-3]|nr:hypothetical protein PLICRDRAFT_144064 [Plicaturopsis crispa FD-325 SS-3]
MFRTLTARASTQARSAIPYRAAALHSTPVAQKTITEKAAEVADTVNKKVGQGLSSALETGEKAADKTKGAVGSATEETKKKAHQAGQKSNQAVAGAREGADDFKREVKK